MIEALNPEKTIDYVCKEDEKDPTTWHLKRLTIAEETYISEMAVSASKEDGASKVFEYTLTALHIGLIGADNFSLDGEPVKFERDNSAPDLIAGSGLKPLTGDTLMKIPREVRDELAGVIINGGKVAEVKN